MSHPSPVPILASTTNGRTQLNSPPIPSFPRQQSWASKEFGGSSSAGWAAGGMSMSPPGGSGLDRNGTSAASAASVWAPSGSWRGEGWQGMTLPPASPSAMSSQLPLAMSYHSASSPFRQSSFLPASPALSSQELELSMSVDSMPSSLPHRSQSELGSLISQHNAFAVAREGSFGSGGFTGPASVERLSKLEQNFTSNFTCCGIKLKGLHDLLEHYEESHVLVGGGGGGQSVPNGPSFQKQPVMPRSSSVSGITPAIATSHFATSTPPHLHPQPNAAHPAVSATPSPTTDSDAPHTPGMMDIEMDDAVLPSPFPHPARSTSLSSGPSPWSSASALSQTDTAIPQCVPPSLLTYSLPSRATSTPAAAAASGGLLVGAGTPTAPTTTAAPKKKSALKKDVPVEEFAEGTVEINVSSGGGGEKRFRCPVEGCGKVYKQQNGLKYHLQRSINSAHGRVNGTITPSGTVVLTPASVNATPLASAAGSPASDAGTAWSGKNSVSAA